MLRSILLVTLLLTFSSAQEAEDDMQAQQAEFSMKRTACLVLSRYHSNSQKQTIDGLISSIEPENQQKFINKMYATAVEHCLPTISMDETQKFFVEDATFNPEQMFYIYDSFDYSAAANSYNKLTKNQESIVKFMKNFDEQMQVRREEKEATDDVGGGDDSFEMKFFGISPSDVPSSIKIVYFVVFMSIIFLGIGYGLTKVGSTKKPAKASNKRRASPKKTK